MCRDEYLTRCTILGMAIGSISTRPWRNCISNITFRDVDFTSPFKAIYIKSNPGQPDGTALVSDILYENIRVKGAIWWPIYIGPQQQKQPGGGGPGCFDYPIHNCETNAQILFRNIKLRNVKMTNTIWPFAGAIRANSSSPGQDFDFENVYVSGGLSSLLGFKCENIHGSSSNVSPKVCF